MGALNAKALFIIPYVLVLYGGTCRRSCEEDLSDPVGVYGVISSEM